jgi:hypothetical protein
MSFVMYAVQLLAEEQAAATPGSGGFSLGGTSLWKSATEMRDDKLQKLAQAIPQLVKQVEVSSRYSKTWILNSFQLMLSNFCQSLHVNAM